MTQDRDKTVEEIADEILDSIMDMVDNDGRLSLDTLPIISKALRSQAERYKAELKSNAELLEEMGHNNRKALEKIIALEAQAREKDLAFQALTMERDVEILRSRKAEKELAEYKLNHNTAKWTELLSKRMDKITALEAQAREKDLAFQRLTIERDVEILQCRKAESRLKAQDEEIAAHQNRIKVLEQMERQVMDLTHPNFKELTARVKTLEGALKQIAEHGNPESEYDHVNANSFFLCRNLARKVLEGWRGK